jgi:hypothetical protein
MRSKGWIILSAMLLAGCASSGPTTRTAAVSAGPSTDLSNPQYFEQLKATCAPPIGWPAKPIEVTPQCTQQTWESPSGNTAYGIIHFRMPFPVAHDLLLWFFLNEMRSKEGEVTLVEKRFDDALPGLRYVARGGKYTVRSNLLVDGFDGWVVYAGTLTANPVDQTELSLAEQSREETRVGHKPE